MLRNLFKILFKINFIFVIRHFIHASILALSAATKSWKSLHKSKAICWVGIICSRPPSRRGDGKMLLWPVFKAEWLFSKFKFWSISVSFFIWRFWIPVNILQGKFLGNLRTRRLLRHTQNTVKHLRWRAKIMNSEQI